MNAHREDASSNGAEEDEMQVEEDGEEFAEEEEGYDGMEKNVHQGDDHHSNKDQTMTVLELEGLFCQLQTTFSENFEAQRRWNADVKAALDTLAKQIKKLETPPATQPARTKRPSC